MHLPFCGAWLPSAAEGTTRGLATRANGCSVVLVAATQPIMFRQAQLGRCPAMAGALPDRLSGQHGISSVAAATSCSSRCSNGTVPVAVLPPAGSRRRWFSSPAVRLNGRRWSVLPCSAHSSAALAALAVEERADTEAAQSQFSRSEAPVAEAIAATAALRQWMAQEYSMERFTAAGSPDATTVSQRSLRKVGMLAFATRPALAAPTVHPSACTHACIGAA